MVLGPRMLVVPLDYSGSLRLASLCVPDSQSVSALGSALCQLFFVCVYPECFLFVTYLGLFKLLFVCLNKPPFPFLKDKVNMVSCKVFCLEKTLN